MNELIKGLAEQAGGQYPRGVHPNAILFYPKELEKFAELLIRKCEQQCLERAKVLDDHLRERGQDMSESAFNFTNGAISGSLRNAQYIRRLMDLPLEDTNELEYRKIWSSHD